MAGHAVVSVRWGNPRTEPPAGHPRVIWEATILDRTAEREIIQQHAPAIQPGQGWCHAWTWQGPPPKRWSPERKAATRRARLRARLEKKVPLFADLFEAAELSRRPQYFTAEGVAAEDDR